MLSMSLKNSFSGKARPRRQPVFRWSVRMTNQLCSLPGREMLRMEASGALSAAAIGAVNGVRWRSEGWPLVAGSFGCPVNTIPLLSIRIATPPDIGFNRRTKDVIRSSVIVAMTAPMGFPVRSNTGSPMTMTGSPLKRLITGEDKTEWPCRSSAKYSRSRISTPIGCLSPLNATPSGVTQYRPSIPRMLFCQVFSCVARLLVWPRRSVSLLATNWRLRRMAATSPSMASARKRRL